GGGPAPATGAAATPAARSLAAHQPAQNTRLPRGAHSATRRGGSASRPPTRSVASSASTSSNHASAGRVAQPYSAVRKPFRSSSRSGLWRRPSDRSTLPYAATTHLRALRRTTHTASGAAL